MIGHHSVILINLNATSQAFFSDSHDFSLMRREAECQLSSDADFDFPDGKHADSGKGLVGLNCKALFFFSIPDRLRNQLAFDLNSQKKDIHCFTIQLV